MYFGSILGNTAPLDGAPEAPRPSSVPAVILAAAFRNVRRGAPLRVSLDSFIVCHCTPNATMERLAWRLQFNEPPHGLSRQCLPSRRLAPSTPISPASGTRQRQLRWSARRA